jgi:7,8-dihydroneopterin aldolase/epimerase/oxygenase
MSDMIFIKGLVLHAHHGVMPHEGEVGQRFVVDLELKASLGAASRSDRLADTISYAAVVDEARRVFMARRFKLIEAAAGAVAQALLDHFPRVEEARVTVHKPHAPIAAILEDVGVALTRRRGD